ncbi:hypothetical protein MYX76_10490 [Desulfobacterota bacterium AH_259_B03_O07]|nr:hypothetical protein [Desulfobacterota bacterium AH_259_B03_O07]
MYKTKGRDGLGIISFSIFAFLIIVTVILVVLTIGGGGHPPAIIIPILFAFFGFLILAPIGVLVGVLSIIRKRSESSLINKVGFIGNSIGFLIASIYAVKYLI